MLVFKWNEKGPSVLFAFCAESSFVNDSPVVRYDRGRQMSHIFGNALQEHEE